MVEIATMLKQITNIYISAITTKTISAYTANSTNGLPFGLSLKNFMSLPLLMFELLLHKFMVICIFRVKIKIMKNILYERVII